MCLISKNFFPRRAKEDIICYKAFRKCRDGSVEPFIVSNFKYNKDIFLEPGIEIKPDKVIIPFIDYLLEHILPGICSDEWKYKEFQVNGGWIHSKLYMNNLIYLIKRNYYYLLNSIVLCECIIPKGALYYEGIHYDYASSKLIINKIVKLDKL